MRSKILLQLAVAAGGLVPVGAGLAGILLGPSFVADDTASVSMDSHFRYLSGLLLGTGIAFWMTIPDLEHKGVPFRLLTAIVFAGGLSRVYSLVTTGIPNRPMLFGLAMELVITPLLALWQYRIEKRSGTV